MLQTTERRLKIRLIAKILAIAAIAGLSVYATIRLFPVISDLRDPVLRQNFLDKLQNVGPWSVVAMFAIQLLQIILAIIPGEPVEIAAGVLFGGFGGLLLCEAGILVGQTIVFLLVRRFGKPFVELFFEKNKLDEMKFLQDSKKLETTLCLLYLIPGTPKDVLCYLTGLTKIKLSRFLLLSGIARIPSVVTSTFAGAAVGDGDLTKSILLFLLVGALGLTGILIRDTVVKHLSQQKK